MRRPVGASVRPEGAAGAGARSVESRHGFANETKTGLVTSRCSDRPVAIPVVPGAVRLAEAVIGEDRMAVEAEQRAYDRQGADWNQEVNPVIIALRDLLICNGVSSPT